MISGKDGCCSVVLGTLVGVSVFSVMWSELLKTSAISCPLWSSVYECQRVECAFTSPVRTVCGMFVMCCLEGYINVCNCDVFSVVNVYLDHLKFCVVCIMVEGIYVVVNVLLSLISVMIPPPALCNLSVRTVVKLCTLEFLL